MTATVTEQHYLIRHAHPGAYGDRPTPWEVTFTCGCGEELWEETEGYGSTPGSPGDALETHLDALATETAARHLNAEGWTCGEGGHEPGQYDTCPDCQTACDDLAGFLAHAIPDYLEEYR
ncbi:MAG: hypothetical protein L0G94_10220 [Brachybacterium sp.]|uniref:hypothetical protein n=1 Tax=Brachybacterium sp. TaxID=1891286 RepID=UPI0026477654|nr:hypothetical protein [Brachybacterium sp.]MDN5687029.1 hypothetical protein [Brachybacterium sp.]